MSVNQDVASLLAERSARYATVAFVDLQGQLRGKTVAAAKIPGLLQDGIPFAPHNMMLDLGDHVLWPAGYLQPDLDIGDNMCEVVAAPRTLPFEEADSNLFFFAQFAPGTQGYGWDPRQVYQRVAARASTMGLTPSFGFEYEFRVFDETAESLATKSFADLKLVSNKSTYGGVMHQRVWSDFFKDLRKMCDVMEVPAASTHWEVAASMGEVALTHAQGMRALDNAVLFKTYAKTLAAKHGMLLSFMARPISGEDGQSGHVHFSLTNDAGDFVFHDPPLENGISELQGWFIGGLQRLLPEFILMLAPNVNSYKRFQPGIFAPTSATWGVDNRTCAIRAITGKPAVQHLEIRAPGADTNPYLVAAAILAAGLSGIEERIPPTDPTTGSAYKRGKKLPAGLEWPRNLLDACNAFRASEKASGWFGDDFVEMMAGPRRAQWEQFAFQITNIELERFLELS